MKLFDEILPKLKNAHRVVVLTGAGVSAESGIKTFRDPDGLWAKFNPAELASMKGFLANPKLVSEWYEMRRNTAHTAKPNPGHYAIAEMQNIFPKFTLITQNVDRLHQRAGSENVIELHGNIVDNKCFKCGTPYTKEIKIEGENLPKCEVCGGLIRPDVVWFGEMLPEKALNKANQVSQEADVFFSIGTTAEVFPAGQLPLIAKDNGAFVIEINIKTTTLTPYIDVHLAYPSGVILPALIDYFKKMIKNDFK